MQPEAFFSHLKNKKLTVFFFQPGFYKIVPSIQRKILKFMNKKLLSFAFILLVFTSKGQIVVTPGGTAASLVSGFVGAGLTISSPVISCTSNAYGTFTGGASSTVGISNGIILTTGSATGAIGINNSASSGVCNNTSSTDVNLTSLDPQATLDPCILEFDIIPQCNSLTIRFVFGSEEYPEYVSSGFNDAFGFFITGPNPAGGTYNGYDVARIPPSTIVSIDNVNATTNPAYYVNNAGGTTIQYDGLTTQITSTLNLTPCATYHFKLAIADAGDCVYDSGVFVDFLQCTNVMTVATTNTPATTCGVSDGTATANVSNGFGPFSYTWSPTPGGGQGTANATGLTAGTTYTVTVDDIYACIPPVTATAVIGGPVAPTVSVNSATICSGNSTTLTATPSAGGGTYLWSPGGDVTSSITVNPGSPTTYTCSYTLSGCTNTGSGTVTVNSQPTVSPVSPVCSGLPAFNLTTDVSGGTWSGTGITNASSGTFTPSSATMGTNVITYTAPGGCFDTIQIMVSPGPDPSWTSTTICAADGITNLDGLITGTTGGTWSGSGIVGGNSIDPTGLSGAIPITYTVGTSCISSQTNNITILSATTATWNTTSVCQISSPINLDSLVTGTTGGTWSGTGVTGSTFNPSGLSGPVAVTYTVGTSSCSSTSTQNINVVPLSDASWTTTSMCSDAAAISLDASVTGTPGGTWSGTGVTGSSFDPAGLSGPVSVTYTVGPTGCQASSSQNIVVTPVGNAAWTTTSVCTSASAINLDSLVTGTSGGTWSGTGVSGSMFDPAGLSGNIPVTYIVGTAPCQDTLTQNISVVPLPSAAWTTASLCSSAAAINLDSLLTGTVGGTWSGTGVTGSSFDPAGLSGGIAVTYSVGPVGCSAASTQNITVTPASDPAWTTTSMCASASPVNLNTLLTGTSGGTWSGTGVSGSNFDPAGLSGPIAVTYTVGTAPCISTSTQNITVTPIANPAWTTTSVCANATPVNLNSLVTGTSGGTWSGTGVTGSTFNPSGLSGSIPVTYTVGTAPCTSSSTLNITVTPNANAAITAVSPMCVTASPFTLTAANTGGVWSGTGITNPSTGAFSPTAATPGTYTITYAIGGACGDTSTTSITVLPNPSAAWSIPPFICETAGPVNLNTLITGAAGGTFSGSGVTGSTFDPSGLSGTSTITYTVTQSGCTSSSTQTVSVDPISASFTATPLTGLAPVSVTTINTSSNAVFYAWTMGNGATSTAINPSCVYSGMGNYTIMLVATNASGCMDTASVLIHVDEISVLSVPNVFTPNGDGHNDTFHPVIAEGLSEFKAVVYDRWGLKMHEWTDENQGWDGKAKNGKEAPDGTYYYIISGKGVDGKEYDFTGFVQLFN
jgi:gliding motility-associated-like protein